ncbi:MAG: hypothetical protein ACJAXX_002124 [Roseivirga sp.]|jgi:hypothetical protein
MTNMVTQQTLFPNWMRGILLITAVYNIFWGFFISIYPESFFHWVTESQRALPEIIIWQGRAVLVMGILYFFMALHPGKLWFMLFFGAFTKIAGALWFYFVILDSEIGRKAIFHLLMNDAIWVPFLIFLGFRGLAYKKMSPPKQQKS